MNVGLSSVRVCRIPVMLQVLGLGICVLLRVLIMEHVMAKPMRGDTVLGAVADARMLV